MAMHLDYDKYFEFIRYEPKPQNEVERLLCISHYPIIKVARRDFGIPSDDPKLADFPIFNSVDFWGQCGQCHELISLACGEHNGRSQEELKARKEFNGPSEVVVEVWEKLADLHFKHVYDVTYRGVKWLSALHGCPDSGSLCFGIATAEYQEQFTTQRNDEECIIPASEKHPEFNWHIYFDLYTSNIPLVIEVPNDRK